MMEDHKSRNDTSKETKSGSKLFTFILENLLLISFLFFVTFGAVVPVPGTYFDHKETVYVCIIGICFINGLYLRTSKLKEVLTSYKAAIYGIVAILGLTPIINSQLLNLLEFSTLRINSTVIGNDKGIFNETLRGMKEESREGIGPIEFKLGLILYFCMPCTTSSSIVMVSSLNGHLALAIFLVVFTNTLSIFTTPLYVKWLLASNINVDIDIPTLILRLTITLFLPLLVGKTFRCNKRIREFITPRRSYVRLLNILFLDILIWTKVSRASLSGLLGLLTVFNALFIIGWTLLVHAIYLLLNALAGWVLRLPLDQRKTIVILCGQKTIVAVAIASFLPDELGDKGLIVVTIMLSYIVILVSDSLLVTSWGLYEKNRKKKKMLDGEKEELENV